jgi:hypothetical protein
VNNIPLTPCESSNVAAWGYQGDTLAVQFRSGAIYHYASVPPEVVAQMQKPDVSIGSFISKNIRSVFQSELQKDEVVDDE